MHRHVYGRKTHLYDTLYVLVGHIGKGYVIAVDKGQTRVVVLEVDRLSHSLWILVDKAKYTAVLTGMLFIHKRRFKDESDILVLILFYLKGMALSAALYPYFYL